MADIYALTPTSTARDELAAGCAAASPPSSCRRRVERLVFALAEPERGRGMSAVDLFTFSAGPAAARRARRSLRGLHPMMAERLRLWRLSRTSRSSACRRPRTSTCSAGPPHDNPKDERLFAIAEVRDLTPVRDEDGRTVALPELERMLLEALERDPPLPGAAQAAAAACTGTA